MGIYVSRQEMDALDPAIWRVVPHHIRGRLPARLTASSLNTVVLREGFTLHQGFLDRLFDRLHYEEGTPWLQWKLVAAFYLIQEEVGPATLFSVGRRVHATIPWPPTIRGVADALESLGAAFLASHENGPNALIGGWRVMSSSQGSVVVESSTLYPCHLEEGVVTGICDSFAAERPRPRLLLSPPPKRFGGKATCVEVRYTPCPLGDARNPAGRARQFT